MTDLATVAAATGAKYIRTQTDRGTGFKGGGRYVTIFEKLVTDSEPGSQHRFEARGESDTSQAAADTNALASLNGQRVSKYGAGATAGKKGNGTQLTIDT